MANRINPTRDGERNKRNPQSGAAINYFSETSNSARTHPKQIDDLIKALANAYENRRARQVTEWERMRQYNVQPAAR